ncbi:hypothetical protein [Microbacterium cremeum]|uniref:hypothetical protein n=1 Tax=Microbacterium cremeum TaxID=2782169 RepID=UPI001889BDFB|nr:hypothetical protein [Microbacterium cremeum]
MRRTPVFVAALAIALALSACASGPGGPPPSGPSVVPSAPHAEGGPIDLVGLWRVADAAGEADATWLRLDAGEFQLWRDCGMVMGSWRAGHELIAAFAYAASGECTAGGAVPAVPWLDATVSYEKDGDRWILRDAEGDVTASLFVDGAPEPIETAAEFYTEPPVIDARVREHFAAASALPPALEPVTTESLVGRWVPRESYPSDPHVDVSPEGTWTGSDGCNGGSGRWAIGDAGDLFVTAGPSTLIGCEGVNVPWLFANASLAGFDGGELVLLDRDAEELGRLTRG